METRSFCLRREVRGPMRSAMLACLAAMLNLTVPGAMGVIHGTVAFPATANLTPNLSNPVGVAVADLDGDGWSDVVASANNTEKIVWYRNNGDGSFGTVQHVVTTSPSSAAFSNLAVGDLNADGRPDVVYWSGASIKWSPNLGGSNPAAQFGYDGANVTANQFAVAPTSEHETTVALADLNGDNRLDVLSITANPDRTVAWVPNLVTGFGPRVVISTAGQEPSSIKGVDLDQDGRKDLLVTSVVDHTVAWFRNLGAGIFGARQIITNNLTFARDAAVGDINGDGRLDVVCLGAPFAATAVRWHAQNAPGSNPLFGPANIVTQIQNGGYTVSVRDMNSDGALDVLFTATLGNKVVWCENLGGGNFGDTTSNQRVVGTLSIPTAMTAADFDQNGTVDVVGNANAGAVVAAFRNQGGQTALATLDTAPATLVEGRRDDVLRVAVSNKGIAGDTAAQLGSLTLHFTDGAGTPLNSAQANALLDKVAIHLDADGSGTFDPSSDPAAATVTQLTLANGALSFPFTGSVPANIQIAPGATRHYFVVVKMTAAATAQSPSAVRVTHRSVGPERSVLRDAASATVLTTELAGNSNVTSALVTATPQAHTYTDWSYITLDAAGAPGTGPLESQWPDAIPNLLKYGLAIDPLAANAPAGLPAMVRQGSAKTFRHLKPAQAADLTYQYDISRALSGWQLAVENVDYVRQDTMLSSGLIQRDLIILGPWQKSFLRVRVLLSN